MLRPATPTNVRRSDVLLEGYLASVRADTRRRLQLRRRSIASVRVDFEKVGERHE